MSVSSEVQQFINKSLADNNNALLDQISKLVADSADNVKRASVEAAYEQLREIKKLRREDECCGMLRDDGAASVGEIKTKLCFYQTS